VLLEDLNIFCTSLYYIGAQTFQNLGSISKL